MNLSKTKPNLFFLLIALFSQYFKKAKNRIFLNFLFVIFFASSTYNAFGQTNLIDVRSLGLGKIIAPVSSFVNPAALSLKPNQQISISYENRFLTKELSSLTACYQHPSHWIDFSVFINYYGYSLFNETRCGLNVSKLLNSRFALGVRAFYFRLDYVDIENIVNVFGADVGFQYLPVDNLCIGVLISNPFRVSFKTGESEYDLPVMLNIGLKWLFADSFDILFEVEKDTRYPICIKSGFAYRIEDLIELRLGILTSPWIPTLGIGYKSKGFGFDVAGNYHPVLGLSPSVSIHYSF